MKVSILRVAALAALLGGAVPSFAYDYPVMSTIASLTIPGAAHGLGGVRLAPVVIDAAGVVRGLGDYSYSINASSYDVSFNFSPSLTSGAHVDLYGPFGSNTSASTDFQISAGASTLTVCASCAPTAVAQRAAVSLVFVMAHPQVFTWDTAPGSAETVRVYLLDGKVVFAGGAGFSPLAHCGSAFCRVDSNVNAYPAGSVPISTASWNGSGWSTWTDDRPPSFQ